MVKRILLVVVVVALLVPAPGARALQTEEVLGLVAMPLAVAAVSEISGVPSGDLIQLVAALNDTRVAPVEFVEVVRYSPVLLVDPVTGPELVTWVTNEVNTGISSDSLVLTLRERIRESGIETIEVTDRSRVVLDRRVIVPDTVVRRVEEIRNHPHGGPPGQIKKEVGVQTGAEIVHGTQPGGRADADRPNVDRRRNQSSPSQTGRPDDKPKPNAAANPGKGKGQAKGKKDRGDR